jgi:hypothetical protein
MEAKMEKLMTKLCIHSILVVAEDVGSVCDSGLAWGYFLEQTLFEKDGGRIAFCGAFLGEGFEVCDVDLGEKVPAA